MPGLVEVFALLALCFVYAGDPAPAVNEAHYLVKAKNFWDPSYCAEDLFASSGKAHTTFYWTFGALTQIVSLEATAWIGRFIGWLMLSVGLRRCCRAFGLPPMASLAVAVLWIVGIEYGNLAGEWVVGGIEGKVPAYALVLIGTSEIARRHWSRAWVWFGGAAAFHVLTGGWAVIASMFAFLITERIGPKATEDRKAFFSTGLFVGGALSLLGLIPAINLTLDATTEQSATAARIYTYFRIQHHLLPYNFPVHWFVRHGVLILALILCSKRRNISQQESRVTWVAWGAVGIAAAGLILGTLPSIFPDLAAKLLRYYWFRLSDAIVPLAVALHVVRIAIAQPSAATMAGTRKIAIAVLVLSIGLFGWSMLHRNRIGIPPSTSHRLLGVHVEASPGMQQQSHRDWVAVCEWINVATPVDEIFLTPRHQQTFKWYANRAEVVNWKDVPQNASALIQWQERFEDVFPKRLGSVPLNSMRVPIGYAKLKNYRQRYGVRFMVVDNRIATDNLPLVKIYPTGDQSNETYSVYELPY